jgi:peptidyl-prolyl cis-trans isomerase D
MRKNLKSLAPVLWFVIIAFIISIFAVWGGGSIGGGGKNIIAKIGKEKISRDFYYSSLVQRLQAMSNEYKELDANFIQQLNIPQQVLEQIVQRTLLLQRAKDMGLKVSDDEIAAKIKSYPVFQKNGNFAGFEQYQKILSWNRISISEFEKSLESEILIDKVIKSTTAGVIITEDEVWENYKKNTESARLEYAVLDVNSIKLETEPQEAELTEYFNTKKDNYRLPERREAEYVFFKTDELKPEIQVSEKEISKYYNENEAQFKEPEQTRVSRIYFSFEGKDKELVRTEVGNIFNRLKKDEDFGVLAEIYSQDDKASSKGDWGLFEWRNLPAKEQEALKTLAKDEYSELIESEDGIAILKVTEKEPEKLTPVEQLTDRITTILKDQKARGVAEQKIAQFEKNARKGKSLNLAAQKFGYKIKNTGLLKQGDTIEDIDPSGSISSSLFSLKNNGLSSPVYTYKGVGLAQLKKIEEPRPASYEEVKEQVKDDFTAEKKKSVALEKMNRFKAEFNRSDFDQLAEKYKMEYKSVEEHKRGQYLSTVGENQTIDSLAFSLDLNDTSNPIEFENGYTIIRVLDRKVITKEDFTKEKENEKEKLLESKKNKFFQSFLAKLREDKNVKIRYDIFLKVNSDVLSRFSKKGEE